MSADALLLAGGRVVDVEAGRIVPADVLVRGGRIAAVGPGIAAPPGTRVLDVRGRFVAPGFIDSHLHIESSLLCPLEFARRAVAYARDWLKSDAERLRLTLLEFLTGIMEQ